MCARREAGCRQRLRWYLGVGGVGTEVHEGELRWLERAVAVADGGPHPVVAEADDVGPAVPGEIGEVPGMLVDPPPRS